MNAITAAEIVAHLQTLTAVELRKLGATLKIKGASKGKKADLVAAISEIRIAEAEALANEIEEFDEETVKAAIAEEIELAAAEGVAAEDAVTGAALQLVADETVDAGTALQLGAKSKVNGRSRAGMVIIAKGSEFHKSGTFKAAAEAEGWDVELTVTIEEDEDGEEIEKHTAVATRDGDEIVMIWNGKAYDYPASHATFDGKGRKIRNLKEALRKL